jgi:hypothetical protein
MALCLATGAARAADPAKPAAKPAAKAAAKNPECPVCKGMVLSSTKDKAHPTEVTVKGKKYYCCDKCTMAKKTKAKTKA